MKKEFWVIVDYATDEATYYCGYFKNDAPVFSKTVSEAVHIATEDSANYLLLHLNKILPCVIEKYSIDE